MALADHRRRTFANDDAGCHGIACRHPRHDRAISDTQALDAVDPERTVYHRTFITPHLGRARVMMIRSRGVAYEIFKLIWRTRTGHDLALRELGECS